MSQPVIPLVRAKITDEDKIFLREKIQNGLLEDEGEVIGLEEAFAASLGATGCVATNSGTSATQLALLALGVRPGDDVIVPSYTCVALVHAIRACHAQAVVVDNRYDVRRSDFHLNWDLVSRSRTAKTKAIIVPHMFGALSPIPELGIPVLEDFTQSLGARKGDQRAGGGGAIGICSLHASKMIAALQGGIVVCRDAKTLEQVRLLNEYDSVMDRWRLADEEKLRGTYHIGFNFRMSALQAALANSQLRRLPQFIARRKEIASYYTRHFERLGMACPEVPPDESNVFFRYMVEVSTAVPTVLARLLQKGIQAGRGVYPPLHLLLGLPDEKFPEASRAMRKLISVPVHPSLSDREVEMIAEAVGQDSR